jgi:adenosylcobinamide-phosphate synthase
MEESLLLILPLLLGYILDTIAGDPQDWPHPIRFFGNAIAFWERLLNKSSARFTKGAILSISLVAGTFLFFLILNYLLLQIFDWLFILINSIFVWYGLANHNLISEGKAVFKVLNQEGIEAGRTQLSRIVGRDTSQLSPQQIRVAVLETMSENLSDGVVAPLFFYALGGVPGMMAYKMINTLDSMIGYRSERYEQFGKFAARLDDVANFIPARLTAFLMILVTLSKRGLQFMLRYGSQHKSPNSGYPEATLAGILNCRFGGPNVYHGKVVEKPFIGETDREIQSGEIGRVAGINHKVCFSMVLLIIVFSLVSNFLFLPLSR